MTKTEDRKNKHTRIIGDKETERENRKEKIRKPKEKMKKIEENKNNK